MKKQAGVKAERTLPISAVALITSVEIHTLRYWETVFFPILNPVRTPGGQRRYRNEDIQTVFQIKRLLRDEMFSLAGAKRLLESRIQFDEAA